ncbi:hypothetical protein, partial [uncultured Roseovarius sp.]|uniref:hypothetical protein n=1 Tax=uncultured Roseovarius sp. TaxID=293344 RepID=UPI0025EA8880
PAQLGQVIKHRTAEDTAADHDNTGGGFHGSSPLDIFGSMFVAHRRQALPHTTGYVVSMQWGTKAP